MLTVVALCSGESEFYATVTATSMAKGAHAMPHGLGSELKPRIRYDATPGAGIAHRRGVGQTCAHACALDTTSRPGGSSSVEESRRRSERRRLGNETCGWKENMEPSWSHGIV